MDNKKVIWDYFKSLNFTQAGASSLMGVLEILSEFNPKKLQDSFKESSNYTDETYTEAVDDGDYENFSNDGAGYGINQWSFRTRKLDLLCLSKIEDKSIGDLFLQLDFIKKELTKNYSKLLDFLKKTDDIDKAIEQILQDFVDFSDKGLVDVDEIRKAAQNIYKEYTGKDYKRENVVAFDNKGTIEIVSEQSQIEPEIQVEPEAQIEPELSPIKTYNNPQYINAIAGEIVNGIWGDNWKKSLTDKLEEIVESLRMTSVGPDQYYKVVKGDTLTKIANKFNTTIEKIVSKNSSIYPSIINNFINVGWILKI